MNHSLHSSSAESSLSLTDAQVDGPIDLGMPDMPKRRRLGGDVCAIFVHAGAGYHSLQNEKIHLTACEDAAKSAMTFLNNGATAVDAVEIAIKVLEDKEITNAGFGSNLAMDGTVECDATIVDHYGRSGAVGAVGCVRNPIHLARLVLEHSTRPLTLRRVPPNLLVGPGATEFASESGMPIVLPDFLVSTAAGERYARWKLDLNKARITEDSDSDRESDAPASKSDDHETAQKRDTLNPDMTSVWNESQPFSPRVAATNPTQLEIHDETERKRQFWSSNEPGNDGQSSLKFRDDDQDSGIDDGPYSFQPRYRGRTIPDKPSSWDSDVLTLSEDGGCKLPVPLTQPPPTRVVTPSSFKDPRLSGHAVQIEAIANKATRQDEITDTVGAIAVDCFGNIAAGSSSGGIGMKHKGRVGPAALVGIGTAVIPFEVEDFTKTSVATVTSGTGEHMATTMAAGTCAGRLYSSTKRTTKGRSEPTNDDNVIKAFVEEDFMGHPSIRNSHSAGAIGILGVKKTTEGVALYFAHNTDSFAVASMATDDREPRSVMSRGKGEAQVVHGARMVKHRRWSSPHRGTWPANPADSREPEPDRLSLSKRHKRPQTVKQKAKKPAKSHVMPDPALKG